MRNNACPNATYFPLSRIILMHFAQFQVKCSKHVSILGPSRIHCVFNISNLLCYLVDLYPASLCSSSLLPGYSTRLMMLRQRLR